MNYVKCTLNTGEQGMYNITGDVKSIVSKSGVKDGICVVYCPHTTASVVLSENVDIDVKADILSAFSDAFPKKETHLHYEGNAFAHIRSTMAGASAAIIIDSCRLILGEFQGLFFMEFDGPRTRNYYVKIIGN
jgi:secondary thiamine-phosphate synthase enzyme